MKPFIREAIIIVAVAVVVFILMQTTIQSSPVFGSCMEPTLQESGERLLINRLAYNFGDPQRGDIITLWPNTDPDHEGKPFIKRIIGMPGETVEIKGGKVYIDGTPLSEPYVKNKFTYSMPAVVVPADHYFVLGDNRDVADDSHIWGAIPRENIIGEAFFCIWPPSKWGFAPNYSFAEVD